MMSSSIESIVPKLDGSLVKGDAGRILVVGGSEEYTGAPYFAAMSALITGVDLAHVMCHESAATAIKSYSPELIVHPFINSIAKLKSGNLYDGVRRVMRRVDAVIVGPGLGQMADGLEFAQMICKMAMESDIPVLLDGDGITLLIMYDGWWNEQGRKRQLVVTPNHRELTRLCEHYKIPAQSKDACKQLSLALGNAVILLKGPSDLVSNGIHLANATQGLLGCPRRPGGQGDILAGCVGALMAWNQKALEPVDWMECAGEGARRVRVAAAECYAVHGRSMLASDLLTFMCDKPKASK